jgi:hypothetical protein
MAGPRRVRRRASSDLKHEVLPMRRQYAVCRFLVGISVLGALWGCSRSPEPAVATPGAASTATPAGGSVAAKIGAGQLSGHTYTHGHFKLSVEIPDDWYIQNKAETDQLAQQGAAVMKQDAGTQAMVQAAKQRTLTLLSAFRHPPGTPVPFNASFIITVEDVSLLPGIKSGEDYLKILEKSLSALTFKMEVEPIDSGFKIGAHAASRLRVHMHVGDRQVEQEYYGTRDGDYALIVILSYGDEEQGETLHAILDSLKAG